MLTSTTTGQVVLDGIDHRPVNRGITVVQTFPPPEDLLVRVLEPSSVTNPADLLHEAAPRIVPLGDDETAPDPVPGSRGTGPRDPEPGPAGPDPAGPARRAGPGRRSR